VEETFAKEFNFNLAGISFLDQIQGLLRLVDKTKFLYGNDFPFKPGPVVGMLGKNTERGGGDI